MTVWFVVEFYLSTFKLITKLITPGVCGAACSTVTGNYYNLFKTGSTFKRILLTNYSNIINLKVSSFLNLRYNVKKRAQ